MLIDFFWRRKSVKPTYINWNFHRYKKETALQAAYMQQQHKITITWLSIVFIFIKPPLSLVYRYIK